MRLLRVTTLYREYLDSFYSRRPEAAALPYAGQKRVLDEDAFGWCDAWSVALAPLGWEAAEIYLNARTLQRAWARERLPSGHRGRRRDGLVHVTVEQVRAFRPDVLWFDHTDARLLAAARAAAPTIRLVLGWSGSAVPECDAWHAMDLVLTCAPEAVERFRGGGLRAELLHHGFDERIVPRLADRAPGLDVTFVGQLARGQGYHQGREALLLELAGKTPLAIFAPLPPAGLAGAARAGARRAAHAVVAGLRAARVPEGMLRRAPGLRRASRWRSAPDPGLPEPLRRLARPAVYGLEMFQTLRDSRVTLNIHADSSPRFASNMRLFEATGAGSCLLTDRRENLGELFEEGREVVAYGSAPECAERIRWLLGHPEERAAVARAGRARTLRDHTFRRRAERLDGIVRGIL